MKKCFAAFIIIFLFLTGCSSEKERGAIINNPYEIFVKGKVLSYYDTESQIDENEFDISNCELKDIQNAKNNLIGTDKNKNIRFISITDSEITTYKQIAVGDSIKKVINVFDNEYKIGDNRYSVLFNGTQEEDPANAEKDNSWIWINYITDGDKITRIMIYDVKFGRESR